jgi:hypothetical protein
VNAVTTELIQALEKRSFVQAKSGLTTDLRRFFQKSSKKVVQAGTFTRVICFVLILEELLKRPAL